MRLTVLGWAGSFPGPDSACSCYLVDADGFRLLVDFGTGSLSAVQRFAGLYSIDAIVLSHLHGDHMFDACSYVVARRYAPDGPAAADPAVRPGRRGTNGSPPPTAAADDRLARRRVRRSTTLSAGTFPIGPFTVTAERVNHPVETYGLRLEHGGRALAYSADTGAVRRADPAGAQRRRCSCARRATSTTWTTRPTCTSPAGRRANTPPRRASAGCCSPTW